jgi:septum formation protein
MSASSGLIKLILASASSRRHELLSYLTTHFDISSADIDESPLKNELPEDLVRRLAESKADTILRKNKDAIVIGADTIVTLGNVIFGKPENQNDSIDILSKLAGKRHIVMTCVAMRSKTQKISQVVKTDVEFTGLSKQQMQDYWQTGEPQDKAGSYAIQGIGGKFVSRINGSYSNVVGLPLVETQAMLAFMGIHMGIHQ